MEKIASPEVDDTPDDVAVSFSEGEGYTVKVQETSPIPYDSDLHFSVEIAEGYSATDSFAVVIGGETLTAEGGVYTVKNVRTPKHIQVVGVADITAPAVTVNVGNKSWNNLSDGILFTEEKVSVSVAVQDAGSGVKESSYLVSDKHLTLDELKAINSWTAYAGGFEVNLDPMAVVYVKAADKAGNVTYVGSDVLMYDVEKPQIQGIENGGVYTGSVAVTVTDFALASITVNGETVYEAADGKLEKQAEIVLAPANAEQSVVVTDLAGNAVTYTVTVEKEEVSTPAETEDETESDPVDTDRETESESETDAPDKTSDNEKNLTWLWVTLAVVIVAIIAVAVIFFGKRS